MKKGIINHNQCCMRNVWFNGSDYITNSTEFGYQLLYICAYLIAKMQDNIMI
jgi:hypothetical protein